MEGQDLRTRPKAAAGRIAPQGRQGVPQRSRVGGWAIAAVLTALALIIYTVRYALLPFVFAVAIAFVFDPLVRAVQRRLGCRRWVAGAGLYIAFLMILGGFGYWIGGTAVTDAAHIAAHAPEILESFLRKVIGNRIELFGQVYTPRSAVQTLGKALPALIGGVGFQHIIGLGFTAIFSIVLALVLIPYFMISGPRLAAGSLWLLPPERRPSVEALLPKLVPVLRRYLIGLALVVLYTASVGWIGFGAIFNLPHAPLIAITVGLLELIPVVGPLASASLVGIIAVQETTLTAALFLMVFALALRLSIDNVVGPLVLGQAARVHPVVVILGFVCGVMLFGIVGLILAVPVAVTIKTTLAHYYSEPVRSEERE